MINVEELIIKQQENRPGTANRLKAIFGAIKKANIVTIHYY